MSHPARRFAPMGAQVLRNHCPSYAGIGAQVRRNTQPLGRERGLLGDAEQLVVDVELDMRGRGGALAGHIL